MRNQQMWCRNASENRPCLNKSMGTNKSMGNDFSLQHYPFSWTAWPQGSLPPEIFASPLKGQPSKQILLNVHSLATFVRQDKLFCITALCVICFLWYPNSAGGNMTSSSWAVYHHFSTQNADVSGKTANLLESEMHTNKTNTSIPQQGFW